MTIRPWGKEKTVNTTTFGSQENCVVAALTDGGYVVAWLDYSQGTSTVEYARFNALGVSVETRSFFGRPDRNSYDPHVAALSDGGSSLARLKLMNFKAGQLLQSLQPTSEGRFRLHIHQVSTMSHTPPSLRWGQALCKV